MTKYYSVLRKSTGPMVSRHRSLNEARKSVKQLNKDCKVPHCKKYGIYTFNKKTMKYSKIE